MRSSLVLLLSLALLAASLPAGAAQKPTFRPAVFCDGEYALCITALCKPIPSTNNVVTNALCSCDVVNGWSMGPGSCSSRTPVKNNGRTYLISTYSNDYNNANKTTSCSDSHQPWAWCYGAKCVVDPTDPKKALCNCPVKYSPEVVLGKECGAAMCAQLWSAATPDESEFANCHYYNYMQKNQPTVPVNPPAQPCSGTAQPCPKPPAGQ